MSQLTVCAHPCLQDALARLRDKNTPPPAFRALMENAGEILCMQALSSLKLQAVSVPTPLKSAAGKRLAQPIAGVVILRAGLGLLPGLMRVAPEARIGHIGLYRNEETLNPVRYYVRLPPNISGSFVILLDPMLATGGSAAEAIRILKTDGARRSVSCLCWRRKRASAGSIGITPMSPSSRQAWTRSSIRKATSFPDWATPATGSSGRNSRSRSSWAAAAARGFSKTAPGCASACWDRAPGPRTAPGRNGPAGPG
jgi:uracil phosphoribosyltransferase